MKRRYVFLFSVCLLFSLTVVFAQSAISPDSSQIAELTALYEQAGNLVHTERYDSAILMGQELVRQSIEWNSPAHEVLGYVALAGSSEGIGDREAFFQYAEKAQKIALENLPPTHPQYGAGLNIYSNALNGRGDYSQAIQNYERILDAGGVEGEFEEGIIYTNLAASYALQGDHETGLRMYEQSQKFLDAYLGREDVPPPDLYAQSILIEVHYQLGWCYGKVGDKETSTSYIRESIRRLQALGEQYFAQTLNVYFRTLAMTFVDLKQPDSVAKYLQAHHDLEQRYPLHFPEYIKMTEAEYSNMQGELNRAVQQYQQAAAYQVQFNRRPTNQAQSLRDLARAQLKVGDLEAAFLSCEKGLEVLTRAFPSDTPVFPAVDEIVYPLEMISLLRLKGELQEELARQTDGNPSTYDQEALNTYELAAKLASSIRRRFFAEGSKLRLSRQFISMYEGGIQTALRLYERSQDPAYLAQAFSFAEKGKAVVLYESLQQSAARKSLVPDSLLLRERTLKRDIAYYKTQIFETRWKGDAGDSVELDTWEQKLFDLEGAYQRLLKQLEEDYPSYHTAKYKEQLLTLSQFQALLPNDQTAAIEYFQGDSMLYVFVVSKSEIHILTIGKLEETRESLNRFQLMLTDIKPIIGQGVNTSYHREFANQSYLLYQHLLQAAIDTLSIDPTHIILIPDGILYHLPFEVLLSAPVPESQLSFDLFPFLLTDYVCSYEYSASLYAQSLQTEPTAPKLFGGFAPKYGQDGIPDILPSRLATTRENLTPLFHTQQEVQHIQNILGGDLFLGTDASIASFQSKADSYQILHLAMHALGEDSYPEYSSLVFSSPEIDSVQPAALLYASEIERMELQADLAVLSACNTGAGEWVRGGGVISLGRAFRSAGCANVLMSLWQADDKATSVIMQQFYKELKQGKTQAQALQAAKIFYIQENHHTSHPYFWGGFVLSGADRSLHMQRGKGWVIGGVLVLLLGIVFLFIRSRKTET
ncbi:MAG: CHAT domain-containing tetratricopeptide repeat protein [Bacteroidota bacterium]